ncbi:phosphotransferase [Streptomyces sp. x-80]|uniref:phosphotransferase n=1 Tax=Streptomyces sp. x-80 TaxID=2789282 RepID=UPI0039808BCD
MGRRPVVRHGDYSPRNWLWDDENGTHSLIDFEKSGHGIAVEDLVWLCGALWPTRPDLKRAFLTGYGRKLSNTEQQVLLLLTARLAVSYLHAGSTKHEPVLIEAGPDRPGRSGASLRIALAAAAVAPRRDDSLAAGDSYVEDVASSRLRAVWTPGPTPRPPTLPRWPASTSR